MARILAADDDLEIQELIKFALENEGHTVEIASDGEEALRKIAAHKPDLVLLDVMMPKLTGFEICEKLRNDPATCLLPIILLTSLAQTKDRITGIKLGADEYFCKPFEPVELAARIEALLRRVQAKASVNPLTDMPGNTVIQEEVARRLTARTPFALIYLDIDNMKSFNDAYGFERGDSVLRFTAAILRSCAGALGVRDAFLGYSGEDDFILIVPPECAEVFAREIMNTFATVILKQYDQETFMRGYLVMAGAAGEEVRLPLMSVSMGIVYANPPEYRHPSEVLGRAKDRWKEAKARPGSAYIL